MHGHPISLALAPSPQQAVGGAIKEKVALFRAVLYFDLLRCSAGQGGTQSIRALKRLTICVPAHFIGREGGQQGAGLLILFARWLIVAVRSSRATFRPLLPTKR